jgi:hypothetical protein
VGVEVGVIAGMVFGDCPFFILKDDFLLSIVAGCWLLIAAITIANVLHSGVD